MGTARGFPAWALVALTVSACENRSVVSVEVASVEIAPPSFSLVEGESRAAQAVVRGPEGETLSGHSVSWSTDATGIATVDASGTVHAVGAGQTTLRATVESVRANASVTVLPGPSLELSTNLVALMAISGGDSEMSTVEVTNGANGVLSGLSVSVDYRVGEATGWLTAGLSGTTAPAELSIVGSASALPAGSYHAIVTVLSPVAGGLSDDVAVSLDVSPPPPAIVLDIEEVSFGAVVGGQLSAVQAVAVTNGGSGVLNGLQAAITYAAGDPGGWLTATLEASEAPTMMTIEASPGSLPEGVYHATVAVSSAVASNSPRTLSVQFEVASAGGEEEHER